MNVYLIEYKRDKSFISNIIGFVTQQKYSHSAMVIGSTWCELDATNQYKKEPDFHTKKYKNIRDFLKTNPEKDRTEAFRIPKNFSPSLCTKAIEWWTKKQNKKTWYGYTKLFSFILLAPLRPFMRWYYRKTGKPYSPKSSSKKTFVCSVAVDVCTKECLKYDLLPMFDERTTYPGLFAKWYADYKVK
jgi:hypothetical protein